MGGCVSRSNREPSTSVTASQHLGSGTGNGKAVLYLSRCFANRVSFYQMSMPLFKSICMAFSTMGKFVRGYLFRPITMLGS